MTFDKEQRQYNGEKLIFQEIVRTTGHPHAKK